MKNKKIIYTIITILWIAVIFGFSLQPAKVSNNISGSFLTKIIALFIPGIMENADSLRIAHLLVRKCAHFTEYFILGVLCVNALRQYTIRRKGIIGAIFCALVAIMDETIQLFVPGRDGRILDVMIDSAGAVTGIVIVVFCMYLMRKKQKAYANSEKSIKKE